MDALARRPAVETWPVDRLRPYERNSRRHSPEQIEQIAASIRQ
jgi:ParB-like chromosome segregation protein Spo0J